MVANEIESTMIGMLDTMQARNLARFFKCGKGEYGEGDQFLGIRVPQTRSVVRRYRDNVNLQDIRQLIQSPWHEIRLAGFLLMIELYRRAKKKSEDDAREIVRCYIESIDRANNWDLVDLSATYILGDWLVGHSDERQLLYKLAEMDGRLWHQRVAMVANWILIRNGQYAETFKIAELYLSHSHDLIHKASGWMLREVGKRGGSEELRAFLDCHAAAMPRTMLRYAIEKFSKEERTYYMNKR